MKNLKIKIFFNDLEISVRSLILKLSVGQRWTDLSLVEFKKLKYSLKFDQFVT